MLDCRFLVPRSVNSHGITKVVSEIMLGNKASQTIKPSLILEGLDCPGCVNPARPGRGLSTITGRSTCVCVCAHHAGFSGGGVNPYMRHAWVTISKNPVGPVGRDCFREGAAGSLISDLLFQGDVDARCFLCFQSGKRHVFHRFTIRASSLIHKPHVEFSLTKINFNFTVLGR